MQFYAHHGCYEQEQKVGTHFIVTISFNYDDTKAAKTDNVYDAVSYLDVYQVVKREMMIPSHLLENVALRIKTSIINEFTASQDVKVKLCKLNPPLGGQIEKVCVSV